MHNIMEVRKNILLQGYHSLIDWFMLMMSTISIVQNLPTSASVNLNSGSWQLGRSLVSSVLSSQALQ